MRIEQITVYRCDGCGTEAASTLGWCSLIPLLAGQSSLTVVCNSNMQHPDYCGNCVTRMRGAFARKEGTG